MLARIGVRHTRQEQQQFKDGQRYPFSNRNGQEQTVHPDDSHSHHDKSPSLAQRSIGDERSFVMVSVGDQFFDKKRSNTCDASSMSLSFEAISSQLDVISLDDCSIDSTNFGAPHVFVDCELQTDNGGDASIVSSERKKPELSYRDALVFGGRSIASHKGAPQRENQANSTMSRIRLVPVRDLLKSRVQLHPIREESATSSTIQLVEDNFADSKRDHCQEAFDSNSWKGPWHMHAQEENDYYHSCLEEEGLELEDESGTFDEESYGACLAMEEVKQVMRVRWRSSKTPRQIKSRLTMRSRDREPRTTREGRKYKGKGRK